MAGFFAKGKMESYLVAKILIDNEDIENDIIGLKEFSVVKKKQIDLIFCKDVFIERRKIQTSEIYLGIEFKKWYSFDVIDGFSKEHIKAIKSDIVKLKELLKHRNEAEAYFILFLVDPAQMILPKDIKYYYGHNNKFGHDEEVFSNRKIKIIDYISKGFDIPEESIDFKKLGIYRDITFNIYVAYVKITNDTVLENLFSRSI